MEIGNARLLEKIRSSSSEKGLPKIRNRFLYNQSFKRQKFNISKYKILLIIKYYGVHTFLSQTQDNTIIIRRHMLQEIKTEIINTLLHFSALQ